MSTSPWLTPTPSPTPTARAGSSMSVDIDPWATQDSNLLRVSNSALRSRKTPSGSTLLSSSPSGSGSQVVDRHPLRSPSPSQSTFASRPSETTRRPSAVASEWKAIGAGLAGLFNGSSTSSDSSSYKWPADPVSASGSTSLRDEAHKGHTNDRIESTLGRIEDWFGLKDNTTDLPYHSSQAITPAIRVSKVNRAPAGSAEQVRVLIHPVAPTDTLSSLALHYGADIHVLRKSNKLWPGDPVQIRKTIYVPVDSCKHRPPNAEIKVLSSQGGAISTSDASTSLAFVPKEEEDDMSLNAVTGNLIDLSISGSQSTISPLASMADPAADFLPDTNKSYSDPRQPEAASLGRSGSINGFRQAYPANLAPSMRNAQSLAGPSRTASSVGGGSASASATSAGFVPPRGPLHVSKVPADSLRFFANDKQGPSSTAGSNKPGPGDAAYDPGESGIDDLLAIETSPSAAATAKQRLTHMMKDRPSLSHHTSVSNMSDMEEEEWKPNTWHFGSAATEKRKQHGRMYDQSDNAYSATLRGLSAEMDRDEASHSQNTYLGWNDAPPTHAVVAKAYDGGKAYNKRQAQKSHRLLYDLAAGLPANPGAASKWARPIQFGDSLPAGPKNGLSTTGGDGARHRTSGKGFGQLLDDTIRGRISVEAALEGAFATSNGETSTVASRRGPPRSGNLRPLPPPQPQPQLQQPWPETPPALIRMDDPLSAPLTPLALPHGPTAAQRPAPARGLSKRRVDWTRGNVLE